MSSIFMCRFFAGVLALASLTAQVSQYPSPPPNKPGNAIILGARGVGRVGSMLGSVSSYVMHHAKSAVFVAHGGAS